MDITTEYTVVNQLDGSVTKHVTVPDGIIMYYFLKLEQVWYIQNNKLSMERGAKAGTHRGNEQYGRLYGIQSSL